AQNSANPEFSKDGIHSASTEFNAHDADPGGDPLDLAEAPMMPYSAPGNLPAEPNSFIGRERDLAELVAILRRVRALSLCGPGGIGKPRLALRLGAMLAAHYPDGVWIADLADVEQAGDDRGLVPFVTAVLGITQESDRRLADTLAEALRPRTTLLI